MWIRVGVLILRSFGMYNLFFWGGGGGGGGGCRVSIFREMLWGLEGMG